MPAWHLSATFEHGQRHAAHVGREFEIVESVSAARMRATIGAARPDR
jgi:hypothetical protein